MPGRTCKRQQRKGNIMALAAVLMVPLGAIVAFSVDLGYIYVKQAQLQTGADAAAVAAAAEMRDSTQLADAAAQQFATMNVPNSGEVLQAENIEYGVWDSETRSFVIQAANPDAVRVTLARHQSNGNSVSLFFARVLGIDSVDLTARAVALAPPVGGASFQLLIDDEMIDSDEADIEALASAMGMPPEEIIRDRDHDGFIDLPPGTVLELPTGQVGDEGLFDITTYPDAFPFKTDSQYTTTDFIAEGTALESSLGTQRLQDVEWNNSNAPHNELKGSKLLDPTPGVTPVDRHSDIAALVDPSVIHVSPVFDDDISVAESDPSKYGSPAANLQGERRGLVAYKIIGSSPNPAGGSYLPLLTIEIIDPATIDVPALTIGAPTGNGGSSSGPAITLVF